MHFAFTIEYFLWLFLVEFLHQRKHFNLTSMRPTLNVHAKITHTIYLRRFEWESNTIHFRFTVYDASANNTFFNMWWKYCGWCQSGVSLLSVSLHNGLTPESYRNKTLAGIVGEAIMLTDEMVGKILNRL